MTLPMVFSLTTLILYLPANILPFMTIELYGNRQSTTIWQGIITLFDNGSRFPLLLEAPKKFETWSPKLHFNVN